MEHQGLLPPRVGVNAVVVRDNSILLIEFDDGALHYNLPGGGVDPGESIHAALHRELREEACCSIVIERLLLVWEYFPPQYDNLYGDRHKLGLVFLCSLTGDDEPSMPARPDPHQAGMRWIPLDQLETAPLLPNIGGRILEALNNPQRDFFAT